MIRRFFTRLRNRDGQALILCAIIFPLVLLFLAFVVDTAHAFVDQRHLQNTADAASLAAAQQLNGGSPGCSSLADCATQYVSYNSGPTISGGTLQPCKDSSGNPITTYITQGMIDQQLKAEGGCYQSPFAYDPSKPTPPDCSAATGTCADRVAVWLYECNPTFFGGILGISHVCVTVHSVSQGSTSPITQETPFPPSTTTVTSTGTVVNHGTLSTFTTTSTVVTPGTVSPGTTVSTTQPTTITTQLHDALFAMNTSCASGSGITIGGSGGQGQNVNIKGQGVISNGAVSIDGNNKVTQGAGDINMSTACGNPGGKNSTNYSSLTHHPAPLPWPETFDAPTICASAGAVNKPGAIIINAGSDPNGVYCSDTSITVQGNGNSSMLLTLIAPQVYLIAGNLAVAPFYADLLAYDTCGDPGKPACVVPAPLPTGCDVDTAFCYNPNNSGHTGLTGVIWVPNGDIDFSGNSGATGLFEAQNVFITGNGQVLVGQGGTSTTTTSTVIPLTTISTTSPDSTTIGTSTGTVTTPDNTVLTPTTTVQIFPGSTQTTTVGTSTDLKLKQ